jgi:hypothetical protein
MHKINVTNDAYTAFLFLTKKLQDFTKISLVLLQAFITLITHYKRVQGGVCVYIYYSKMIDQLKNEVIRIEEEAIEAGCTILWSEAQQDTLAILMDEGESKVIALFAIEPKSPNSKKPCSFRAFNLDVHKWNWASTEGFTPQQMYEKFQGTIFKEIPLNSIVDTLS